MKKEIIELILALVKENADVNERNEFKDRLILSVQKSRINVPIDEEAKVKNALLLYILNYCDSPTDENRRNLADYLVTIQDKIF